MKTQTQYFSFLVSKGNTIRNENFVHSGFLKTCDALVISLVKSSSKYYDDCGKILGNMILRIMSPKLNIPWHMPFQLDDPPIVPTTVGKMMELRYNLRTK